MILVSSRVRFYSFNVWSQFNSEKKSLTFQISNYLPVVGICTWSCVSLTFKAGFADAYNSNKRKLNIVFFMKIRYLSNWIVWFTTTYFFNSNGIIFGSKIVMGRYQPNITDNLYHTAEFILVWYSYLKISNKQVACLCSLQQRVLTPFRFSWLWAQGSHFEKIITG